MCLPLAVHRPDNLLAKGEHMGHEWNIMHNGSGVRCGYVKVLPGHPWFGRDDDDISAEVHGDLTYSDADEPCNAEGLDNGWWVGFDCGHAQDLPDSSLAKTSEALRYCAIMEAHVRPGSQVRSQEYVEAECRKLCEQAAAVA
jgi:hypothetical protein